MENITVVTVILAAIWGGMVQVMKVVEMMNNKRDLVLNINKEGCRLDKEQKEILLKNDFKPIWIGVLFFLALYVGAFFSIPIVAPKDLHVLLKIGCVGTGLFGIFAFIVMYYGGKDEIHRMQLHIDNLDEKSSNKIMQSDAATPRR